MKIESDSSKKQYPIFSLVFVFLAVISFCLSSPFSFLPWFGFPVATGLTIFFAYESTKLKSPSARLIGKICLLAASFLVVITILGYIFNWHLLLLNRL